MQHTTKRINPVTGKRYESLRLRDILAAFVNPAPSLIHCPATLPGVGVGQTNNQ